MSGGTPPATREGSGLGLAIARSFTELQKGTFAVDVDGDLFKVTLVWKKDLVSYLPPVRYSAGVM